MAIESSTTYYEILQLREDASSEVIRAAYKSLIQKFHPDKQQNNPKAIDYAKSITQAYEVLSDIQRRAQYDERLRQSRRFASEFDTPIATSKLDDSQAFHENRGTVKVTSKRIKGILWFCAGMIFLIFCGYLWQEINYRNNEKITQKVANAELILENDKRMAYVADRESRTISPFNRKIVVHVKPKEFESTGTLVIFPKISFVLSKVEFEKSKAYFEINADMIAKKIEIDLARFSFNWFFPGDNSDSGLTYALIERVIFKSIYDNYPDEISNLCQSGWELSGSSPKNCVGVRQVLFPKKYWTTVDRK